MRALSRPLAIAVLVALVVAPLLPGPGGGGGNASALEPEEEPNSSMAQASQVQAGTFYTASLDARSDPEDWFKVWAPKGMVLNVTIHHDGPGLNADLEVHYAYIAGRMDRLWSMTDYDYETVCTLTVDTQYYYIRVFARWGTGTYTLDVGVKEAPVLTDGSLASGTLYNNSHHVIDYYRVWLEHRGDDADLLTVDMTKEPIAPAEHAWLNMRIIKLYDWNVGVRYYDISWEHEDEEHVRAAASDTGWYFIRVNAYNGSGEYSLTVSIDGVEVDGNDRLDQAPVIYGPGLKAEGSLHQALDHRDCYALHLDQWEALSARLELEFPLMEPAIFSLTILEPDGDLVGEWTNYDDIALRDVIEADMGTAMEEGLYYMIVEVKVAVAPWTPQDLTDLDGKGNYTLHILPSGHNTPPVALWPPRVATIEEDGTATLDLTTAFSDAQVGQGDSLTYHLGGMALFHDPAGTGGPVEVAFEGPVTTVTPALDWSGKGVLSLVAEDLFGATTEVAVLFDVVPVDDPPVALKGHLTYSISEGEEASPVDLDEVFTDPDLPYGDTLSFRVTGNDAVPAWIDSDGLLVLGPTIGLGQEDIFTVTATDEGGANATVEMSVRVERAEHAPTVLSAPGLVAFDEDSSAVLKLYDIFTDPDPEDALLSFQWSGNRNVLVMRDDTGAMTLSAEADWWGAEHLTITATDHTGLTARVEVAVRVDPVGDPPVISSTQPDTAEVMLLDGEGMLTVSVTVDDIDTEDEGGHVYMWYLDGELIPGFGRSAVLALDEEVLTNGTHAIRVVVKDGFGLTDEVSWTLEVAREVPPPVVRGPTASEGAVTGGIVVGIWAAVLAIGTEPGRFTIFKFLWVPLYTKIRKDEVLDQFIRGRIFGFIEHNPGVNYSQIKRRMGIGNGTLTHHLNMLERQNFIKAERDGIYKRFYPKDHAIDEDDLHLTQIQRDIFFLVKKNPGISQKEVARELGVSKRVMSYHVKQMAEARLLEIKRIGRKTALEVREEV